MNSTGKIIGALVLFGGGAYGLSKLIKTANTGNKLSVNVVGINPPKLNLGSLILSVNVAFDNPTKDSIRLKKPYLTVFYNNSEVGNSLPSNEEVEIKANDRTTIKGITIQIPFARLGVLLSSLISGTIPKMEIDIHVRTEANGIPYTDKQHFEL